MAIVLDGTTGISAPAIVDLDTPVETALGGTGIVSPGSSTNVLTSDGSVWYSGAAGGGGGGITAASAQDLTGVGYVDFTGIPSTAKRISIMLWSCQAGGADLNINVGTAGGIVTTGYNAASVICTNTGGVVNNYSLTKFLVLQDQVYSANDWNGIFVLNKVSGNKWSFAGSANTYSAYTVTSAGRVDAGAAITTIRVALNGGNFISGTVNIFYE
jgi:hypothetical protein